ncbi:hypothetical protein [Actinomadura rugatobispora]|uniref:Uncharacterized protein n=1 Tax=Actinomadura rugatobispora TaxID=1994 RepID=A0ABW0ZUF2_9ACTN|nr:hypothetical protein GCM10010200_017040 [Actinomadura rugatobispora]
MSEQETRSDWRGGATHVMVLSVLLAVPALKLAWTLGSDHAAREVLDATGPANWLDIVTGMCLDQPLLVTALAVVVSRTTYVYFAGRGGAAAHQDVPPAKSAAYAAIVPVGLAVAVGGVFGLWWGVACGVLGYLMRVGVVVEFATGRREAATGKRAGTRAETSAQRTADAVRIIGIVLSLAVLPALAFMAALDGRSWSSVVWCDVNLGAGPQRDRMITLQRRPSGVVGWDVNHAEVANGTNCAADPDDVIRAPWWRG